MILSTVEEGSLMAETTVEQSGQLPTELSVEQQHALIKEEIQRFTKMAKDKGFLTIEEINDLLPAEIIEPSALDAFMQALEVGGVIITELAAKKDSDDEATGFL